MTYRFNLHSDLHHEFLSPYRPCPKSPTPTAPNLFLAGDIDYSYRPNYKTFLHDCADTYAKQGGSVYYIAGNHCAYGSNSYEEAIEEMREMAKGKPNLHFLYREKVEVAPGVILLGTTLHSHVPEYAMCEVGDRMNDFHSIGHSEHRWTVADHNREHEKDVTWLGETIAQIHSDQKIIVMTHHGPLEYGLSRPEYEVPTRALRHAYHTDLTHHAWFERIDTWLMAHTHHNVDIRTKEGVRIVTNQKGYGDECDGSRGRAYDTNLVIEV